MERNSSTKNRSSSKYTIESDGWGNLMIHSTDEPEARSRDRPDCADLSVPLEKHTEPLTKSQFANFCTESYDGTRKLSINGGDIFKNIGRHFEENDVPDLLIFLQENPDIVKICLPYNNLHCSGLVSIIDHINTENRIIELDVRSNEIRSSGIDHLCELADDLRLRTLRLSGNKFGVESSKRLTRLLSRNRYLQHLDIAEVDQTASSLAYFIAVMRSANETLKVLDMSRPNPGCMHYFDSAHFSGLLGSMLKCNNSLEKLSLRKFGFSCHDIENMMTEGRHNRTLQSIDLGGNNIGDFGIEIIAEWLKRRPALSALVLDHNIVTQTGASALSHAVPKSKIRHLDVSHNRISDSGTCEILSALKKSPRIKSLRLFGNYLGHDTAKIVNRMLLSGVLVQNYLDVKPYRVDHEWFCARYPADLYRNERN